jgi:hypothetical protein
MRARSPDSPHIAILGWGSLIWDPRGLPFRGKWQTGGPVLPIEFSRVSKDCRLTLVLDSDNGANVRTRYALSARADIIDAICDLKEREATGAKRIGYVDLVRRVDSREIPGQVAVHDPIAGWARASGFSAAIWTALPANFHDETGRPFSVRNAYHYLAALPQSARDRALTYIANAPEEVSTPLRREIMARPIASVNSGPGHSR